MKKNGKEVLSEGIQEAERKARLRDLSQQDPSGFSIEDRNFVLGMVNKMFGDDYYIGKKRKKNSKIAFVQIIQPNIQFLVRHCILTQAEKAFLIDISGYIDFRTNVIVDRDYNDVNIKKINNNELPKVANISFISDLVGMHRTSASRLMTSLKNKGVIATAETGMQTEDGRVCTSRTWFVNPNIMYRGDKDDIDPTVQLIFRDALKNIKGKNGEKLTLPVNLFIEE